MLLESSTEQEGTAMTDKLEILKILNLQMERSRENPGNLVRCILVPDVKIGYINSQFTVHFPFQNKSELVGPNWLSIGFENDVTTVSFPNDYLLEFISFINECKNQLSAHEEIGLQQSVVNALHSLRLRWLPGREPFSETEQQRLIGELSTIRHAIHFLGTDVISSWDSDGRALHDFECDSVVLEAKSTTSSPEKVNISSMDQLQSQSKPIFLTITHLSKNASKGISFHEFVMTLLAEISKINLNHYHDLFTLLRSIGFSEQQSVAYKTKWDIHYTRLVPITGNTPLFPYHLNESIPKQVELTGYILHTENFEPVGFDVLSKI